MRMDQSMRQGFMCFPGQIDYSAPLQLRLVIRGKSGKTGDTGKKMAVTEELRFDQAEIPYNKTRRDCAKIKLLSERLKSQANVTVLVLHCTRPQCLRVSHSAQAHRPKSEELTHLRDNIDLELIIVEFATAQHSCRVQGKV
ncbi:hypothetical protein RRG08_028004 [Elysia crispata]|uniref:Uncharacterized protein n=1 Tax=Elysia crispata TaxID=231223 RepID=A0AAE1EEN3_9GAST|nr:hypothetical protein RRG08_028004 [Elysia crispata]